MREYDTFGKLSYIKRSKRIDIYGEIEGVIFGGRWVGKLGSMRYNSDGKKVFIIAFGIIGFSVETLKEITELCELLDFD